MWTWIKQLDRVLRGEATQISELREGRFNVPVFGLAVMIDLLGIIYGLCMGVYSLTIAGSHQLRQIPASMIKVPALFILTLVVTFPSLYVFNALVGSRLMLMSALRLLIASLAIMLAVLASIGPIVAFFSVSTTSYHFMVVLNVAVFSVAGMFGLGFLLRTLHRMTIASIMPAFPMTEPVNPEAPPAAPTAGPQDQSMHLAPATRVNTIFRIWVIVFGLVGAQMAWVLRPFIGNPKLPFAWFRPIQSNFFEAVIHSITKLVS